MRESVRAFALTVVVVACGKSNPKKTPDAPMAQPDAARVCTAVTPGALDTRLFLPINTMGQPVAIWSAPVTGSLGDGGQLTYQLEFYGGIEPGLSGTFDLTAGNQANYQTCAICLRAFDTAGSSTRVFFQFGGSITLAEDPFTNGHLTASLSNVQLQEVTIDPTNFTSTPVANGACEKFGSFTVDHQKAPNAWTCSNASFVDGTTCDCACGGGTALYDPDCDLANPPVNGCTAGQGCFKDGCVDRPTNQTCQKATSLTVNAPGIPGTTIGANQTYNAGLDATTCIGTPAPGPDAVYSVAMTQGTQYTVTLSALGATYDGAIALVGPDANTPGSVCDANPIATCVKGADAMGPGAAETFSFTPTASGTYFVIVTSALATQSDPNFGDYAGTYTIAVTSP
jgi:hypothetical protein